MADYRLTDEQREQVASLLYVADREAVAMHRRSARLLKRLRHPIEEIRSRARLALCRTVATYQPDRGATLKTWVYKQLPRELANVCRVADGRKGFGPTSKRAMQSRVQQFLQPPGGDPEELLIPARDDAADCPLAVWCETRPQRVALNVRARVWLYLQLVEGWQQAEIAAHFGVSRSLVSLVTKEMVAELGFTAPIRAAGN